MPEVKLENITIEDSIFNINLNVKPAEYFTICGPTGAGKTTTVKVIAGLIKPDEGKIYFDGKDITKKVPEERGIGMVFEHSNYALFPHFNVEKNVGYSPRVKEGKTLKESRRLITYMLELVLLENRPDAYPRELSGGMKQRVALARAMMAASSATNLILLDEPLSALDAKIRIALRFELMKLVRQLGLTIIHVTQDTEEALMVSDRIAIIRNGRIVQIGTPKEIYESPKTLFVCRFISSSNFLVGKIKQIISKGSIIKISGGNEILVSDKSLPEKSKVVVAIRSENIEISKGHKNNNQNTIFGVVETSKFVSGNSIEEIKLENGELFICKRITTEKWFEKGEKVTIGFQPEKTLLFKYPKEGLEEAIDIL
ncbi:MAG: ATP-binding cassette domain-containing protein [Candidatus Lokiarchaeota archaeon]|nr:ATP-binding cassette domain-containing protein [Candidatus Lokiarchaeota archaeon]